MQNILRTDHFKNTGSLLNFNDIYFFTIKTINHINCFVKAIMF
jgi:hypothetical protein